MFEAYRVGVSLVLNQAQFDAQFGAMLKQFERVLTAQREMQSGLNEFVSGLRVAARNAGTLASAMEQVARASRSMGGGAGRGGALPYSEGVPQIGYGGPRTTETGLVPYGSRGGVRFAEGGAVGALASGGGGGRPPIDLYWPGSPPPAARGSSPDYGRAAIGFGMVGGGVWGAESSMFSAGAQLGALRTRALMQGFTPAQAEALEAAARTEAMKTPGLTISGAMERGLDLYTVTRDAPGAIRGVGAMSQLGVILSRFGLGDQEKEIYDSLQAGELRGAIVDPKTHQVDPQRLFGFLQNVGAATASTQGRLSPASLLQMARSGGIGMSMLSDQAYFADMVLPLLTLKSSGAGTAIQGFAMQFAAGKMSEAAGHMLDDMGLLRDPKTGGHLDDIKRYKVGIGQFNFPPDVLRGRDDAMHNPVNFIEKDLLPGIDRYLRAHHTQVTQENEMATAMQLASRIPGGKFLADIIRLLPVVERERVGFQQAQGRDLYGLAVNNDPVLQEQAFQAAYHNMMATLGQTMMPEAVELLKSFTASMNAIGDWAKKNPGLAKMILEVAGGLGVLASAIAAISVALWVAAPMIAVAKKLGLGGVAGGALGVGAGAGRSAAIGAGLSKVAFPLLAGYAVHSLDSEDTIGKWVDNHLPGAAWLDNRAYSWSGGAVGRSYQMNNLGQDGAPLHVVVDNGRTIADGVTAHVTRQLDRPQSGPNSSILRITPNAADTGAGW
ncbi:MAG: phage tail tape measure protein [Acetobacteraceae bacterium]|nr:phage tail tape measure protein [Acetobacteraceae bacterium]